MYCLLALLLFSTTFAWAQPEGPWEIWTSDHAITSPEVCVRGLNADILFIEDDSVRYAQFSLEDYVLTTPAIVIFALQGWPIAQLYELIPSDDGWVCLLYESEVAVPYSEPYRLQLLQGDAALSDTFVLEQGTRGFTGGWWQEGFSLRNRVNGGYVTSWVENGGYDFEPHTQSVIVALDSQLADSMGTVIYTGGHQTAAHSRAVTISISVDSFLTATMDGWMTEPYICSPFAEEWNPACYWDPGCHALAVLDLAATFGGDLFMMTAGYAPENAPARVLSLGFDSDGFLHCTEETEVDLPDICIATCWYPDFGFAAMHASPSSLQLARVDTNGTQFLPTGTMFWRDDNHTFAEANLTITDAGEIIAVWTETTDGDTSARRLMLGSVGWDTPLASEDPFIPQPSSLILSAYPNPFNSSTTFTYELPQRANVELIVHNLLGERVAVLADGIQEAGSHAVQWQPEVSSGIYFARLSAGPSTMMQKVVYLR